MKETTNAGECALIITAVDDDDAIHDNDDAIIVLKLRPKNCVFVIISNAPEELLSCSHSHSAKAAIPAVTMISNGILCELQPSTKTSLCGKCKTQKHRKLHGKFHTQPHRILNKQIPIGILSNAKYRISFRSLHAVGSNLMPHTRNPHNTSIPINRQKFPFDTKLNGEKVQRLAMPHETKRVRYAICVQFKWKQKSRKYSVPQIHTFITPFSITTVTAVCGECCRGRDRVKKLCRAPELVSPFALGKSRNCRVEFNLCSCTVH